MQRFSDMSINRKLTLVILLTCVAVLLLAGGAMVLTQFVTTRRAMVQDRTVLADQLGRNEAAALAFHRDEDAEDVNKDLSALAADPHIIAAVVYDKDGVAFGKYLREFAQLNVPVNPPADGARFEHDSIEIARPVEMDGKRIGTIYLRADLGRMYGQIALYAGIVGLILVATIIMTFAVAPRLRRPIAEPILALTEVAKRVAQTKEYSARAVKKSQDEVGVLTDAFNQMLSEIETTQSSLAVAKEAAEAASRAKDQFLAVLSHELRTPLTPVLLLTSLLQNQQGLPDEVQEDIQTIRRHVELEARLIDDLLDLTRIARGKLQLNLELSDAHLLLQDALKICCGERMHDVTFTLAAEQHYVRADPGRLLQIFWNILNNAQKFTPNGQTIVVRSTNPDENTIRIEVIDRGAGIDPTVLPHIFNAFEQGDPKITRAAGGLGLGLTIAKALVDAHGGKIKAESLGLGQGATFTVEVPVVDAPIVRPTRAPVPTSTTTNHSALRLLLVEDHQGTLELMTKLLSSDGHEVKAAATMRAAMSLAQDEEFDLVISDLGLPDGSGLQLMRHLRDNYGLQGICLSGYGMDEDIARSAEAGFLQHLIKPIDLTKLRQAIQSAVSLPGKA